MQRRARRRRRSRTRCSPRRTRRSIGCARRTSAALAVRFVEQVLGVAATAAGAGRLRLLAPVHAGRRARGDPADAAGGVPRAAGRHPKTPGLVADLGHRAMIVNQWLPAAHRGDAVGDNARALARRCSARAGHDAEIFALDDRRGPDGRGRGRGPTRRAAGRRHDPALRGAVADDRGARRRCPARACCSTTTSRRAQFFAPFDARPGAARRRSAAASWRRSPDRVDLALGVSEYNRRELEAMGFAATGVLPLVVDTERLTSAPPVPALEHAAPGRPRQHPLRRPDRAEQEDRGSHPARRALQALRGHLLPVHLRRQATTPCRGTTHAIRALDRRSTRCCPSGSGSPAPVPDDELAAYYRNAHAYVSLSEHEGFCAPLVEAMAMDVPVLAYARGRRPGDARRRRRQRSRRRTSSTRPSCSARSIYDEPFRAAASSPASGAGSQDFSRETERTSRTTLAAGVGSPCVARTIT